MGFKFIFPVTPEQSLSSSETLRMPVMVLKVLIIGADLMDINLSNLNILWAPDTLVWLSGHGVGLSNQLSAHNSVLSPVTGMGLGGSLGSV